MKKTLLILAAIAGTAFVSCQKETNPEPTEPELTGKTYTLTVNATKAVGTKALAFDGANLVTSWAATDKVKVCKHGSATAIGTLSPKTTGSASTSISGSITLTDVNVGDKLDLIFPDTNWTYEGQDGTLETISSSFDFARAEVTVSNISGSDLTASAATFTNEQSLVKFTLSKSTEISLLDVQSLTISAASGKLVKSYAVSGDAYTPVYGDIVITPAAATSEFYVALRNNSGAADTYTLTAIDNNNETYTFVKSGVTFANGHYKSINVKMTKETVVYTVVGSPIEVFGSYWDLDDTANNMVKQADGTYRKTYQLDGTKYPIEFKIVKNHSFGSGSEWPSSNYYIDENDVTKGTLVITFDPSTSAVNGYIESEDTYTVAGSESVFGSNWDTDDTNNDMVKQDDDTYLKTYTIPSALVGTTIEFKVVKNHKWASSAGGGEWPASNYEYKIPAAGTLNISFNPATGTVQAWMFEYTLACSSNAWSVTANPMTKQEDGTWKCVVENNVENIVEEFKVLHRESEWIGDPNNSGENYSKDVPVKCDLIFTYNPETGLVKMDFRVDNTVDDVLRRLLFEVETGTTIEMKAGTYVESNSNYIAFAGKEVTVKAVEGATVVLQPQVPITISGGGHAKFVDVVFDASHLTDLATWYEHLIYASDADADNRLVLENCEMKNFNQNKSAIYCSSSNKFASVVLNNCYFHDMMKSVFFSEGTSVDAFTLTNSTIANISTDSGSYYAGVIDPRGASVAVTVDHCTFYNCETMNTDYGAIKVKDSSNAVVSNCIFMMPSSYAGGRAVYNSAGEVKNCLTFNYSKDSTPHGIHSGPTITNCVEANPLFANPANGDFTLGTGSPALTASETNGPIGDPRWYN